MENRIDLLEKAKAQLRAFEEHVTDLPWQKIKTEQKTVLLKHLKTTTKILNKIGNPEKPLHTAKFCTNMFRGIVSGLAEQPIPTKYLRKKKSVLLYKVHALHEFFDKRLQRQKLLTEQRQQFRAKCSSWREGLEHLAEPAVKHSPESPFSSTEENVFHGLAQTENKFLDKDFGVLRASVLLLNFRAPTPALAKLKDYGYDVIRAAKQYFLVDNMPLVGWNAAGEKEIREQLQRQNLSEDDYLSWASGLASKEFGVPCTTVGSLSPATHGHTYIIVAPKEIVKAGFVIFKWDFSKK